MSSARDGIAIGAAFPTRRAPRPAGWRTYPPRTGRGGSLTDDTFQDPLLVTALAWLHAAGAEFPLVAAAFAGIRPVVVALVALAAWRIGRKSLRSWATLLIAVAAAAALVAGASFPLAVLVAGGLGFLLPVGPVPPAVAHGTAALPADPPTATEPTTATCPSGDRPLLRHALATLTLWTGVWMALFLLVAWLRLAGGRGTDIARLFTETTLLSLGGASAVVPWALDESVARSWLTPAERFDSLAMGEATPGPLILVVTFIGFLAGWKTAAAGSVPAGLEGAAVATLFAFLPSFGMILALAPLVRRIRPGSGLARAMAAIGAVVVSAIVLLGMRLAIAAFVDEGRLAWLPLATAVFSGGVLLRGWAPTPVVVVAAAAFGIALRWAS